MTTLRMKRNVEKKRKEGEREGGREASHYQCLGVPVLAPMQMVGRMENRRVNNNERMRD